MPKEKLGVYRFIVWRCVAMWWRRAILIGVLFVVLIFGVAYMTPAADVGVSKDVFNSTTGTDVLYNFTGTDYLDGSLNIFDQRGAPVRSIDTGVHANGDYSLHWSGDYGNGTNMPDGSYTVNATMALDHYMMTGKTGNANPIIPKLTLADTFGVNASGYIFECAYIYEDLSVNTIIHPKIFVYSPNGSFFYSFEIDQQGGRAFITSIAFNSSGFIFISYLITYQTSAAYDNGIFNVNIYYPDFSYFGQIDKSKTGTPGLDHPTHIAFNSSDYAYIYDISISRVFVISPNGTFLYSWGGNGSDPGQFKMGDLGWGGLAIDSLDQVYIADSYNSRVQKFNESGGFIKQWNASGPMSICIDSNSLVYVLTTNVSYGGYVFIVGVFDSEGTFQRSWNASNAPMDMLISLRPCIVIDNTTGHVLTPLWYLDDMSRYSYVNVTTNDGTPVMLLTGLPLTPGDIYQIADVAVNASGYYYTICKNDVAVQVFSPDGRFVNSWNRPILSTGAPCIAINSTGYVYIGDGQYITIYDSEGELISIWQVLDYDLMDAFYGVFPSVNHIGFGTGDRVYAACTVGPWETAVMLNPTTFRVYTPDGIRMNYVSWEDVLSSQTEHLISLVMSSPDDEYDPLSFLTDMCEMPYYGVATNSTGFIYLTAADSDSVLVLNPAGSVVWAFNGTTIGAGAFNEPTRMAINSSDCVLILDNGNNRIVVVDRNNSFVTEFGSVGAGDGQFSSPLGIGIDSSNDKVYIADTGNNRTQTFEYLGSYYDDVQVTVDNTPPVISGAPTTAANANGWYNGPVTVHFDASDATSGVRSCTGDQILSGESTNQNVTGTAIDEAGNVNTTTVSGINIDLTVPAISCSLSGDVTGDGRLGLNVKATLSASDSLSGVDSVKYSLDGVQWTTYSGTFTIPFGDPRTLYYMVTDKAGNSASGSSYLNFAPASYFHSDVATATPTPTPSPVPTPTITPTPVATPANDSSPLPSASGETASPSPVGTDMLPIIVLAVVTVTLLQSWKK